MDAREWSGGPPGCLAVFGMPSQMTRSVGWPSGGSGVVGRPSQISKNGGEALPDVRE